MQHPHHCQLAAGQWFVDLDLPTGYQPHMDLLLLQQYPILLAMHLALPIEHLALQHQVLLKESLVDEFLLPKVPLSC